MIAPVNAGRELGCNGKRVNGIIFDIGMGRLIKLGGLRGRGGVFGVCIGALWFYVQAQTATATGAAQTQNKIQAHTAEVIAPVTVLDKRGGAVRY
jgi:hypothetical protein